MYTKILLIGIDRQNKKRCTSIEVLNNSLKDSDICKLYSKMQGMFSWDKLKYINLHFIIKDKGNIIYKADNKASNPMEFYHFINKYESISKYRDRRIVEAN